MPIGWVRDAGNTSARQPRDTRNQSIRSSFVETIVETASTIAANVSTLAARILEPEVWTRWQTVSDEKVCPICGPYAGRVWQESDGPQPPLHPNCRCQRVYAYTTWVVRS